MCTAVLLLLPCRNNQLQSAEVDGLGTHKVQASAAGVVQVLTVLLLVRTLMCLVISVTRLNLRVITRQPHTQTVARTGNLSHI